MYLLYVDESGDPGPQGSRFLVLGAAALFAGKWASLDSDLHSLIDSYFPVGSPRPTEIHLAPLRKGTDEYRSLSPARRGELVDDFCGIVDGLLPTEVRMFAIIADKPRWFAKNPGKTGDDLYAALFEDLTSRFDLYLRRRYAEGSPNKGIIIADPHKQALSKSLRSNHRVFQHHGHKWGSIYNLVETIFFLASDESPGLQLADLCAYSVWRLLNASDSSLAMKVAKHSDREPLTSTYLPGKWHGIKYFGEDPGVRSRIGEVWPQSSRPGTVPEP